MQNITENTKELIRSLPSGVELVVAGKTRTPEQLRAAILGGATIIGHNYVQEAESSIQALGQSVRWHFIGHLQRNKAKKAIGLFDLIETVDSLRLARAINKEARAAEKTMPILVEVNSACEKAKAGVLPQDVQSLIGELAKLPNLQVKGLMTMGPWLDNPEEMRPFFRITRQLFTDIARQNISGIDMRILSMGMSDSYKQAIEEGANQVRIGTRLFGPR